MKDFVELFEAPQFSSYGSSLKLLMVAEGDAHVYPRCGAGGGGEWARLDSSCSGCGRQECGQEWSATHRLAMTVTRLMWYARYD
jgi:hypothetical protein